MCSRQQSPELARCIVVTEFHPRRCFKQIASEVRERGLEERFSKGRTIEECHAHEGVTTAHLPSLEEDDDDDGAFCCSVFVPICGVGVVV